MDSPSETNALLRNSTKSYNSFRETHDTPTTTIQHQLQKNETLQGIAVKYGVKVGDILRANNMWAQDSLFLKKTLLIPLPKDSTSLPTADGAETSVEKEKAKIHSPDSINPASHNTRHFNANSPSFTAKFSSSPVLKSDPSMIAHFAQIDDELNPL